MATKSRKITFAASMGEVKTLTSGKIRITIDIPDTAIAQVAKLMECKRNHNILNCTVVPGKRVVQEKPKKPNARRIIKTPYYNQKAKR